jgi:hypothetical protein
MAEIWQIEQQKYKQSNWNMLFKSSISCQVQCFSAFSDSGWLCLLWCTTRVLPCCCPWKFLEMKHSSTSGELMEEPWSSANQWSLPPKLPLWISNSPCKHLGLSSNLFILLWHTEVDD